MIAANAVRDPNKMRENDSRLGDDVSVPDYTALSYHGENLQDILMEFYSSFQHSSSVHYSKKKKKTCGYLTLSWRFEEPSGETVYNHRTHNYKLFPLKNFEIYRLND